jgi:transcriptional regulator with XRE-family HTH domain
VGTFRVGQAEFSATREGLKSWHGFCCFDWCATADVQVRGKRVFRAKKREGTLRMKHPVDVHVGKRVRQRRWMMQMSQQQLAERVGIKFQQIQKYETGMNRISASRLWDIAEVLEVPVSFFFEGLGEADMAAGGHETGDLLADKEAMELVRSYYAIPEAQRKRLFDLARVLSDAA